MRALLIDTCGEAGSMALADGEEIIGFVELPARAASQTLLPELAKLFSGSGWTLADLSAIGVVSGPGSFTGVRVGLACAKGLCEARDLPLIAVSRLETLAEAADIYEGFAVLNAGRDELYIRNAGSGAERLVSTSDFIREASGALVIVAEHSMLPKLETLPVTLQEIDARSALRLVLKHFEQGTDDRLIADANYVRSEQQIYGPKSAQASSRG